MRLFATAIASLLLLAGISGCGWVGEDDRHKMIVSVRDQKMLLVRDGRPVKSYKVSTSKFGVGDTLRSNRTPLGRMEVARKIGDGQCCGAVFKSRRPTGEVLKPNAPGRDPIVSRILWLKGAEQQNRNAFRRFIYIHGTPEEWRLGSPASYGCIRMASRDVIDLYNRVGRGADVFIIRGSIKQTSANSFKAGLVGR
jgi:hypothetical protein